MKFLSLFAACALCMGAAGCSIISGTGSTKRVSGAQAMTTSPASAASQSKADKNNTKSTAKTSAASDTSELAAMMQGEWTIVRVGTTVIDRDEDMPYINFERPSQRFYANNGCNTLNGDWEINAAGKLTFAHTLSTLRMCPDASFESAINAVINDNAVLGVKTDNLGHESYIELVDASGKSLLTLRRHNMDFLNGDWDVVSIAGFGNVDESANVFFDIPELRLHGNTGCNYFNGAIYIDHRRSNSIDFSNMGTTRMACPNTKQETAMLVALEQTASAISNGREGVMLLDASGKELMQLKRKKLQ